MFSGIIKTIGTVTDLVQDHSCLRISICQSSPVSRLEAGASIAINGVCQTVVSTDGDDFTVVAMETTLQKTNLGKLELGTSVNIEPSLRLQDSIDGHLVQGHVQGQGRIRTIENMGIHLQVRVDLPPNILANCVPEGSVTLDGISLTIAELYHDGVMVSIIPYTLKHTTIQYWKIGDLVNAEGDMIGRYVRTLLQKDTLESRESTSTERVDLALQKLREGGMVIVFDSENRENEGDFIIPAENVTSEQINFMARNGCGLICQSITRERAQELNLPAMVQDSNALHDTAFTVSVDASKGTTTGISAGDRALTARLLASPAADKDDFCRPGHIFPIIASPKGLSERLGHTEASILLAELAGYRPSAMICEILNSDGSMARLDHLKRLSKHYDMPLLSISDLLEYSKNGENIL